MDAPPKKKTAVWIRVVRSTAVIVLVPLIVLYAFQNRLLYFPDRTLPAPEGAGLRGVEEVTFASADGIRLVSWWLPPKSGQPTLIFFQGNAGTIADRSDRARDAQDNGWGMLLLGYRGYGRSDGSPDEPGLYRDSRAALAWVRARPEVDPKKLVYLGESLGCAVALELAVAEPPAALILEAPFASLKAIAGFHYPWLPTSLLLRSRFDNLANARVLRCPLLVAHGRRDEVVPFAQGRAVFDAAPEPKRFFECNSHHNDIPETGSAEYRKLVRDFVEGHLK